MREIKKRVRFCIQKRKAWKDETKPRSIIIMFNYDGKRLCTTTGLKVPLNVWDKKANRVTLRGKVKRAHLINACLENIEQRVNDIYYGALAAGIQPDNDYILKELKDDKKLEKPKLLQEWQKYLDVKKDTLKKGSNDALRHSFEHFERFAKGKRIEFDDLEPGLLSKYADYLFNLGHRDNTVHKHLKRMRAFMAYAKKIGLHSNERYRQFNVSEKEGRIVFLTWDEVAVLRNYKPQSPREQIVLDNFIFACLTALRVSDFKSLRRDQITEVTFKNTPGVFYAANMRHKKTDRINVIPLLPEAVEIIERNRNQSGEFALPEISDGDLNIEIKEIVRKAEIDRKVPVDIFIRGKRETKYLEIWKLVTTKTGRKTFLSSCRSRGIDSKLAASIAGITEKTASRYYTGVADKERFEKVIEAMKFKSDTD